MRLPAGELAAVAVNVAPEGKSPFVSANVGLFGFDSGMTSTVRTFTVGGKRIGVTAVLGKSFQKEIHNSDIEIATPKRRLKRSCPS